MGKSSDAEGMEAGSARAERRAQSGELQEATNEIDASRGELLSDIRDYEGRDAGETLANIASPKGDLQDANREIREKWQRRIGAIAADLPVKEL